MTGQRIAHYEILEELGHGGMGVVYKARDTHLDRFVAIKVLPAEAVVNPERKRRFIQEARAASALNHPNIVTIHDITEVDDMDFMVMEFVPGKALNELIPRAGMKLGDVLKYSVQIADALAAAHGAGIVHRDLKPANVMVGDDGRVRVLDFGLAKLVGPSESSEHDVTKTIKADSGPQTREGTVLGTVNYMSPEQAEGRKVDARSDIFAFGAVLYEMVTGRRAFQGTSVVSTLAAIMKEEPTPAGQVVEIVPRDLEKIVERCLRKDAAHRLQHMADVKVLLEDVSPEPETPGAREVGQSARRAGWAIAAAVLLGSAGGYLASEWFGAPETLDQEVTPTQLTANAREFSVFSAAISPDGKYLAYSDVSGLYLRQIETGEIHTVDIPDGFQVSDVTWYPDATRLLIGASPPNSAQLALWVVPAFGGQPRRVADNARRGRVSPDGKKLAYLKSIPSREIWISGSSGENPESLVARENVAYWTLAWSPNSETVAYGSTFLNVRYSIEAIGLTDRETVVLVEDMRLFQNWRGCLPFYWTPDNRLIYGRRGDSPNEMSSNLWGISLDPQTGANSHTPKRITNIPGHNVRDITMSEDGSRLAFLLETNQSDVYIAEVSDEGRKFSPERRLTFDERYDYPWDWTVDGHILVESNRSGKWAVDVLRPDQRMPQVVGSSDKGPHPVGSPDGKWVLYRRNGKLVRASTDGGPPSEVLALQGDDQKFRCSAREGGRCVIGERYAAQSECVFSSFDPLEGRGRELARVEDRPPFTNWDLSADGTRAAMVHADGDVRVVNLDTANEEIIKVDGWRFEFVSWAPGDRGFIVNGVPAVFNLSVRPGLVHVDMEGGVTVLRQVTNEWSVIPTVSPDGRHLAFGNMIYHANAWMIEGF